MGRRAKARKSNSVAMAERATEVRGQARDMADVGGEALKEFMKFTAPAAREFASTVSVAAKEMLEATEKATGKAVARAEKKRRKPRRRLRKVAVASLVVGGIAILTNERVRTRVQGQVNRLRGVDEEQWPSSYEPAAEIQQQEPSPTT